MLALCPDCGQHHEVVRTLDDKSTETHHEVYQLAPAGTCERAWLTDTELFEAQARFGDDAVVQDDELDVG